MLNFPLAPGVHIDDTTRSALSVTAMAPGIPVMIVGLEDPWLTLNQPYLVSSFAEIERWLQGDSGIRSGAAGFASARAPRSGGNPAHQRLSSVPVSPGSQSVGEVDWSHVGFSALKAFFDNGGGDCYLCRSDLLSQIADLPDATLVVQAGQPPEIGLAIAALCQPGSGLFALLDGPNDAPPTDDEETVPRQPRFDSQKLELFLSEYNPSGSAALYYPWLGPQWRLYQRNGEPVRIIHPVAPSAVAAALFQQTDRQTGPWKAPSNLTLQPGLTPLVKVGDASQALFNQDGKLAVNMLREFPGIGVQLWGARTLSAGDLAWTYVPVRRTFDRIERDMQQSLRKVLFKPNGPQTWQQLRNAAESYLFGLFEAGAFAGTTPEQSYQVQVGVGSSMTRQDLNDGILRMNIGLAVVRPAEFIVLEFSQIMASAVSGEVVTPIKAPLPVLEPPVNYVAAPQQPRGYDLIYYAFIGRRLGMSADGRTVIFGGYTADRGIYIYQQSADGEWQQLFNAKASETTSDSQYALSEDGTAAFIGMPGSGRLYFTRRTGNSWPALEEWQQIVPEPVPVPAAYYGAKLAISPDGTRLAVYATQATTTDPVRAGAVYLWYYQDNTWQHQDTLQAETLQENDYFGYQMRFSQSGEQLVIFTLTQNGKDDINVTTCTLDETGVTARQTATVPTSGVSFASLHPSGNIIVIGNSGFDNQTGRAQLYNRRGAEWLEGQELIANQEPEDFFGQKSFFSSDGKTLVVHAYSANGQSGTKYSGKVWIFQLSEGEWELKQVIQAPEDKAFSFAYDIATDATASRLFIGEGSYSSEDVKSAGRVWIYDKQ